MKRVFLDSQTITQFIGDTATFDLCAIERFRSLDKDGNNNLTRSDLCNNLGALFTDEEKDEMFDKLFEQFDEDRDGKIGFEEFKTMLKEMMVALARGIGAIPICIALETDSVFMKAINREIELERRKIETAKADATTTTKRVISCESPQSPQAIKENKRRASSGLFMCFVCGNHSTKVK